MPKLLTLNTDGGEVHVNPNAIAFMRPTDDVQRTEVCIQTGHTFRVTEEVAAVKAAHDAASEAEVASTRTTSTTTRAE